MQALTAEEIVDAAMHATRSGAVYFILLIRELLASLWRYWAICESGIVRRGPR